MSLRSGSTAPLVKITLEIDKSYFCIVEWMDTHDQEVRVIKYKRGERERVRETERQSERAVKEERRMKLSLVRVIIINKHYTQSVNFCFDVRISLS